MWPLRDHRPGHRAGYLGLAVLQCGSKSHFLESLTIEMSYFLARLIKKPTPNQIHLIDDAKNAIFQYLKMENTASAQLCDQE